MSMANLPSRQFISGFPSPPFFYEEYRDGPDCGRPSPAVPKDNWNAFGVSYTNGFVVPTLDSDTKMYRDDNPETDLKDEFKRLYTVYVLECFNTLDTFYNCREGEAAQLRRLTRLHKNLLHILLLLRTPSTQNEVIERLEKQLERRRQCIDQMKKATVDSQMLLEKHAEAPYSVMLG